MIRVYKKSGLFSAGSDGLITINGNQWGFKAPDGQIIAAHNRAGFRWSDELFTGRPGWTFTAGGSGAANTMTAALNDGTHLAQQQSSTGTTTTGYAGGLLSSAVNLALAGQTILTDTEIYIPTLSTVAEEYTFWAGLGDTTATGNQVDGVYFLYHRLTYGANWQICTASSSSRTITDSGVAVVAGAWIRLKVAATSSLCTYYIDGTSVGTNATNIPTSARETNVGYAISKTAGTTARVVNYDHAQLSVQWSTLKGAVS
jgi:hypothetical protein